MLSLHSTSSTQTQISLATNLKMKYVCRSPKKAMQNQEVIPESNTILPLLAQR